MSTSLSAGAWDYLVYAFDAVVVAFIIFSFCRRLKESHQWRKYLIRNWYETLGMIPIVFFALASQISNDYNGYITLGIMLRLLAILYLIRLSRSIEDKSRIFGNHTVLQIFIIFFLTLTVSSFLFYKFERSDVHSGIASMRDALWWTLQTATTSTFEPNATTTEGRIIGGHNNACRYRNHWCIHFIPCFMVGKIESVIDFRKGGKTILKLRLAKGEITKETYLDLQRLLSD